MNTGEQKIYTVRSQKTKEPLTAYSEIVRNLLDSRGIHDQESAEAFLNPNYDEHTHDPFLMKDMDKAVQRFLEALDNNERIVIYSDFDADGGWRTDARFLK